MTEHDLELLESYLDDELTAREMDVLQQRLASEPQLATAVEELRSQRQARQQFFAACAPDEASVQRLIRSVNRDITSEVIQAPRGNGLRWVGSLAACLLVGFAVGRAGRTGNSAVLPGNERLTSASVREVPADITRTPVRFDGPIVNSNRADAAGTVVNNTRPNNNFSLRGNPTDVVSTQDPFPGSHIQIVDELGRVQRQFYSHEQYMKFVSDKLNSTTQPTGAPFAH